MSGSCSSVRKATTNEALLDLNEKELQKFIGTYQNKPLNGEAEFYALWSTLNFKSDDHENWSDFQVNLKLNSQNQLYAELVDDDQILDSKLLKGRLERNFFRINNQTKTDFSYVLLWVLADSSVKFGLNTNNDLVVISASGGAAFLVFFPVFAADTPFVETIYKHVE
ncbi:hypothetical protein Musp01_30990 [Muricauda sp. NBRC 101325]|nr:hypothetical protein Musp01_30990 [Muricauda sp. NBRC 101325]